MKNKIIKAFKDGTLFEKAKRRILTFIYSVIANIKYKEKDVEDNKIMFITFQGSYTCNPKAIVDYILEHKLPYKVVWAIRGFNTRDLSEFPEGIKLVKRSSYEFYKEVVTSKIIVDNSTNYIYSRAKKRKNQIVIQPWHGSMGFKKLEPASFQDKDWLDRALKLDTLNDYVLVNSTFEEDVFRNSLWKTTEFLKVGHPRNDIFFDKKKVDYYTKVIKEKYNLSKDTKIALYAPTFRELSSVNSYNVDYDKLYEALVKRFGGKWVIFVRFHFRMKHYSKLKANEHVINVSDYPDMQELICASDIGITDYSSWLCDFVLTKRPGFLFTMDIKNYLDERGLCYPLESTPFKVCPDNDVLYNSIINFDNEKYLKDVNKYLKKLGCYEDGNACKKTMDLIKKLCKDKKN